MAPQWGRKPGWLSLHNSTHTPRTFTFDIRGSQIGGTITIQGDELINVFTAEPDDTYTVSVSVDDRNESSYEWTVSEGRESLVAELTEDGLVFKEMELL